MGSYQNQPDNKLRQRMLYEKSESHKAWVPHEMVTSFFDCELQINRPLRDVGFARTAPCAQYGLPSSLYPGGT
jgi:hypothetical protein